MATGRISKRSVDALECPHGKDRDILWDQDLSGFGVAVFPSGGKAYIVQYRRNGQSRRIQIGKHGRLTPDEARSEAKKILGQVETGTDPIAAKKKGREIPTFGKVAEDFMTLHATAKRKPRTHTEYQRLLKKLILPQLGSTRIVDLRRSDVAHLHMTISKTAPISANRAIALVSVIWSWASRRDLVPSADNPARGLERNREQGKERFLTSEELGRLGDAMLLAETDGLPWDIDEENPNAKHAAKVENRRTVTDPYAVAAIRLLMLTGARLNEILKAEWSRVDTERGILFLADSKTGRKPVYLSAPAQAIISAIPRIEGNPHLIVGMKKGKPRSDLNKPWASIRRAAGLNNVRIHDLRHTFASFGAGAALGLPVIGKLLGHTQPSTTARYAHLDADPMHRAVSRISGDISAAMGREVRDNVVPSKGQVQ